MGQAAAQHEVWKHHQSTSKADARMIGSFQGSMSLRLGDAKLLELVPRCFELIHHIAFVASEDSLLDSSHLQSLQSSEADA